ncbi:MAG: HEPN domain-containing protein [Candidatus Omnitrophica bacterium]|nr:HEPN domain-containing protein [Candidatus Omnitrophota bacterium]
MPGERRGNSKPWIKKAEEDYEAARTLARKRRVNLPNVVCFHAQQCAEKYLKALLVSRRVYFPKTHDLLELLSLAVLHDSALELLRPSLASLNPYAVLFRYPGEHATLTEARRAIQRMRYIRERLRQSLGLSS